MSRESNTTVWKISTFTPGASSSSGGGGGAPSFTPSGSGRNAPSFTPSSPASGVSSRSSTSPTHFTANFQSFVPRNSPQRQYPPAGAQYSPQQRYQPRQFAQSQSPGKYPQQPRHQQPLRSTQPPSSPSPSSVNKPTNKPFSTDAPSFTPKNLSTSPDGVVRGEINLTTQQPKPVITTVTPVNAATIVQPSITVIPGGVIDVRRTQTAPPVIETDKKKEEEEKKKKEEEERLKKEEEAKKKKEEEERLKKEEEARKLEEEKRKAEEEKKKAEEEAKKKAEEERKKAEEEAKKKAEEERKKAEEEEKRKAEEEKKKLEEEKEKAEERARKEAEELNRKKKVVERPAPSESPEAILAPQPERPSIPAIPQQNVEHNSMERKQNSDEVTKKPTEDKKKIVEKSEEPKSKETPTPDLGSVSSPSPPVQLPVPTSTKREEFVYTTEELMVFRDKSPQLDTESRNRIIEILGKKTPNRKSQRASQKSRPGVRPDPVISPVERTKKRIVEILNKMVKKNAKDLTKELESLEFNGDITLYEELANRIFEKAVQEQMFVDVYAEVCKDLHNTLKLPPKDDKPISFKSLLLKKCQSLFEHGIGEFTEMEKKECSEAEKERYEEELYKKKKSYLGVIMFTTELYKQVLVPAKVVVQGCVKHLYTKICGEKDFTCVEPMHKLLKNVGAQLEKDLTTESKKNKYKDAMEIVYKQLKMVKDTPTMGKRDRFMLEDILELRQGWIRDACRCKSSISSSSSPAPVVRTLDLKPRNKEVTAESVKNLIFTALDEYMSTKNNESVFEYFEKEVVKTGFTYVFIPSLFNYCLQKNLSLEDSEKLASLLCEYRDFIASDHKDLARGIEELLHVLEDVEDATETVISQFATFMATVLCRLNFSITAEFVNCLINLKDCDPFCSWKEKKKFGVSALYFVSTVSIVKKHNPEQAKVMLSKAEGCSAIFNNEEQRKELYDMYDIATL